MHRSDRKPSIKIIIGLFAAFLIIAILKLWQENRQNRLNQLLLTAIDRCDVKNVRHLLQIGADPNTRIILQGTPSWVQRILNWAYHLPALNVSTYDYALIRAVTWEHQPNKQSGDSFYVDNFEITKALVNFGANVNIRDRRPVFHGQPGNATPLILAVFYGKWETVKILLEHGVDINATDAYGNTVLIIAASHGQVELVETLLRKGAIVDAKDKRGHTALSSVIMKDCDIPTDNMRTIVAHLLQSGASVQYKDRHGRTLIYLADYLWHDKQLTRMLQSAKRLESELTDYPKIGQ